MPIKEVAHYPKHTDRRMRLINSLVVSYHNRNMQGVDRKDRSRSYNRITIHSRKWWGPFFRFMQMWQCRMHVFTIPQGIKRPKDVFAFR